MGFYKRIGVFAPKNNQFPGMFLVFSTKEIGNGTNFGIGILYEPSQILIFLVSEVFFFSILL
jgi:hypothetical protein